MATFNDYQAMAQKYLAERPDPNYVPGLSNYGSLAAELGGYSSQSGKDALAREQAYIDEQAAAWYKTLTPDQQLEYAKTTEAKDLLASKQMPMMGALIIATIATAGAAGAGLLGGSGAAAAPGAATTGGTTAGTGGLLTDTAAAWGSGAKLGGDTLTAMGLGADSLAAGGAGMGGYSGLLANVGGVPSMDLSVGNTLFNPAVDSQMANIPSIAGTQAGAAIAPAGVNLSNAGGLMSTGIDYATQLPVNQLLDTPKANLTDLKSPNTTPIGGPVSNDPSWLAGVKDLLPAGALDVLKAAGLIGGAIAGSKETPGDVTTQQSKTDPRVDPYIYGDQGVLKQAQDWYLANKTGVNPTMQQGWDTRLGLLTDPNNLAQLKAMQQKGFGLLSNPIASNPWLKG